MCCLEYSEMMSLYADSLLTEEQEETLLQHVELCSECRAEWQAIQRLGSLFDGIAFSAPPPTLVGAVMNDIARHERWSAFLRGGRSFFLSAAVLMAWGMVPLVWVLLIILGNPPLGQALATVTLRVVDILGTLLRAVELPLRAIVAGPNVIVLVGWITLAAALTLGWIRLVAGRTDLARVKAAQ